MATILMHPATPEAQTLPQNVEAEAAMLGAMMIDNRLADDLIDNPELANAMTGYLISRLAPDIRVRRIGPVAEFCDAWTDLSGTVPPAARHPAGDRPAGSGVRVTPRRGNIMGHRAYRDFAAYNEWANGRLYDAAAALDDAQYRADTGAFFGSIHATLNHLLVTDRIWVDRFDSLDCAQPALDTILFEDFSSLRMARVAEDSRLRGFIK
eukprot:gene46235-56608_t